MISLKAIHTSFAPNRHGFFRPNDLKQKNTIHYLCKSNDSKAEAPPPEGDSSKQELLAKIAMLQAQKVRLTDYLDERSEFLTQFAEEANAEIDQIGENAFRELDEAGARIMENIESQMQAFEESSELNKQEIEENEKMLADFEGQIEKERNEGLFFKNLRQKPPVDKVKAKEEMEKIREVTNKNAGSEIRRNIYLALIGLVVIGIVDALISSSSDWRKVAVLGAILVGLISQLTCNKPNEASLVAEMLLLALVLKTCNYLYMEGQSQLFNSVIMVILVHGQLHKVESLTSRKIWKRGST